MTSPVNDTGYIHMTYDIMTYLWMTANEYR